MSFWDLFWLLVCSYLVLAYLLLLYRVLADLVTDRDVSGWGKALWVVALVVAPILSALVYLVARGRGMADRSTAAWRATHGPRTTPGQAVTPGAAARAATGSTPSLWGTG
ncbi:PLDc N-terminal domain-containing protein [Cellulomonas sp. NPDC055163]